MNVIQAVRWSPSGDAVRIIDQRRLPADFVERDLRTVDDVCDAIATLAVRGAPAIGVAGALGLAAALAPHVGEPADAFAHRLREAAERIRRTRPTAVNLPWAIGRMLARAAATSGDTRFIAEALREEATVILEDDRAMCRRIGEHGLPLIPDGARVLTHCNAGALATAGIGTALAPIYLAARGGRRLEVFVDETRPLLQGSRLTAWELARADIPVTVLADSMAASLMRAGRIDLCIVGADRIAANGDVANKIGTYALAVAARHHGVPFYVAAPRSTFDPVTRDGDAIEIEQRAAEEVTLGFGVPTAPRDVRVHNPAFDITPAELVTAIVSDRGVWRWPYDFSGEGRGARGENMVTRSSAGQPQAERSTAHEQGAPVGTRSPRAPRPVRHVLAIDQGTTGTTCLVVGEDGRVVGRAYREITQHYPRPGWVEHDATEIFERTVAAAREAIARAETAPDVVGITNQRETVVAWDRATGRPVTRAIVWQDRRTTDRCVELAPRAAEIARRTGLVLDPYFSATKLEWLLRQPDVAERAARGALAAGTVDSWLIWCLTGGAVHATEPTNASRTMLFDIDALCWSEELCATFGVPRTILPEVRPSSGDFGETRPELLGAAIPIAGVAGDQQSALFGQGCWRPGEGKNTYGTGAFLLLNTGVRRPPSRPGLLTTIACDPSGGASYALEASIFVAGAAVQWLRDGLGIVERAAETEALARGIASTEGVYFVPALVGLGAPEWEPRARGTIVGLTRGTTRAHLARAALEAMAYATRDVLEVMRECGGGEFTRLRVDGGATENDWLMQFQADVLEVPVERPDVIETTALGAAGLAGLAAGVWPDADTFIAGRRFTRFAPGAGVAEARRGIAGWRRAVRATLAWARDDA